MAMTKERGSRKNMVGVVVSEKMDKTVVVKVDSLFKHPVYKKYIRQRATFKAHDEGKLCSIGDTVSIIETRPMSKGKRWRVGEIVEKNVSV